MSCRKYETQIALYVEGDLPAGAQVSVAAHLQTCAPCQVLAESLRESQQALRRHSVIEPSEWLMAQVRQNVMARIEQDQRPNGLLSWLDFTGWTRSWVYAGVATAVAAILLIVLLPQWRNDPPDHSRVEETPISRPAPPEQPAAPPQSTSSERAASRASKFAQSGRAKSIHDPGSVRNARNNTPPVERSAELARAASGPDITSAGAATVRRIEIQTADPKIRIIWLVPDNEASPNETEGDPAPISETP